MKRGSTPHERGPGHTLDPEPAQTSRIGFLVRMAGSHPAPMILDDHTSDSSSTRAFYGDRRPIRLGYFTRERRRWIKSPRTTIHSAPATIRMSSTLPMIALLSQNVHLVPYISGLRKTALR